MSDPAEIVDFVRDRLDDLERTARAIGGGRWKIHDFDPYGYLDGAVQEHILRHDPARVLAEVDAKRRLSRRHSLGAARGGRG